MPDEQREPTQARVEWLAEWLYNRLMRDRQNGVQIRGTEPDPFDPWPPKGLTRKYGPPIAEGWRDEARELLGALAALEPASPSEQREGEATAPVDGLTAEDRAQLEVLGQYVDCEVALRALSTLDHLTKALEAAQARVESLTGPGDQLQSIASRLAEWVRDEVVADYEVRLAAAEAPSAVEGWTRARTTKGEDAG